MNTILIRNPSLRRLTFTADQETALLGVFDQHGVTNVHGYLPENSDENLPYLDTNHVYMTELAQRFFESNNTNTFNFFASALVINIHHLTRDGQGWKTGRALEKAKRRIRKEFCGIPVQVFVKVIHEKTTAEPIVFTLICVPAMESPPNV